MTMPKRPDAAHRRLRATWVVTDRQTVERATDVFARLDRHGRILYINETMRQLTGLPPAHFMGKTYWEAGLPPALCERWDAQLARVFADGREASLSFDFDTPYGLRHLDFRLLPERDGQGVVAAVLAVGRDVTAFKAMEASLRRSEAQLREAQHIAQLGSWELDLRTNHTVWSEEYFRILGLSPQTHRPSTEAFLAALHPDDRPAVVAEMRGLGTVGAAPCFHFDFRVVRPGGEVRHVHCRGERLFDGGGGLVKVVGTLQDVTGWRQTEEALRRSEARYRLLAENATDMVASFTPELAFTYTSPSGERITGHAAETLLGQPILALVHPDDRAQVLTALGGLATSSETAQAVYRYRHADGHDIWLESTGRAVRDPATGALVGYQATSRDVSERMAAQARLQALSRQQELILETVAEGIYGLDADGTLTFINPVGARMLGRTPGELVGRNRCDEPSLTWACREGEACRLPRAGTFEEIVWRPDGTCFHAEFTVRHVAEPGAGLGTVVTFRDITERKRAETELRVANAQLRRLAGLKDEFLSTVSHELRTPLAAIRNAVAIVAKEKAGPLNATQARFLGIIRDHVARLHRMVDDVLDLQRLEAGSMPHRPVVADVRPLVLEVVNGYSPALAERGIRVAVALAEQPLTAEFDRDRLAQVLLNLLSNAAKFTPEGGRVTVSGGWHAETDTIRLAVEDTGAGIPESELARIFEKFVQADSSLTRQVGGTGLGLSICKTIIEGAHGGRLWVESTEGRGTTFHIALPAHGPDVAWLDA